MCSVGQSLFAQAVFNGCEPSAIGKGQRYIAHTDLLGAERLISKGCNLQSNCNMYEYYCDWQRKHSFDDITSSPQSVLDLGFIIIRVIKSRTERWPEQFARLRRILMEWDEKVRDGFVWLRIGTGSGRDGKCRTYWLNF
jgi:hypothetical protein